MGNFGAKINLVEFSVNKIEFIINDEFEEKVDGVETDIDLNSSIGIDKENKVSVVKLECILFKNFKQSNKPFYLDVEIKGLFDYESDLSAVELENLLSRNAVAILFPYLRSTISNITVNSGVPPVILPTINVVEFLKHKQGN